MSAPLEGLRGVALTETPTAAYAAAILALLGAEVAYIALDPGADEGVDLLRALLPDAAFVLEDCAARVLAEAGTDVEAARAAHPGVAWCAIAGGGVETRDADVYAAWHAVAAVLLGVRQRRAGVEAVRIDIDLSRSDGVAIASAPPASSPLRFTRASDDVGGGG